MPQTSVNRQKSAPALKKLALSGLRCLKLWNLNSIEGLRLTNIQILLIIKILRYIVEDNCHCLYRLCKNTTRCSSFSSKVYSCAVIKLFRTNIVRNRLCAVCLSDLAPGEEDVRKKVEVVAGQVKKEAFDEKKMVSEEMYTVIKIFAGSDPSTWWDHQHAGETERNYFCLNCTVHTLKCSSKG